MTFHDAINRFGRNGADDDEVRQAVLFYAFCISEAIRFGPYYDRCLELLSKSGDPELFFANDDDGFLKQLVNFWKKGTNAATLANEGLTYRQRLRGKIRDITASIFESRTQMFKLLRVLKFVDAGTAAQDEVGVERDDRSSGPRGRPLPPAPGGPSNAPPGETDALGTELSTEDLIGNPADPCAQFCDIGCNAVKDAIDDGQGNDDSVQGAIEEKGLSSVCTSPCGNACQKAVTNAATAIAAEKGAQSAISSIASKMAFTFSSSFASKYVGTGAVAAAVTNAVNWFRDSGGNDGGSGGGGSGALVSRSRRFRVVM